MVENPENPMLATLRDIRAKQDEHSTILDKHSRQFDQLDKKIDAWSETTALAVDLVSHANIPSNHVDEEIAEPRRRVEELEQVL